MSLVVKNLSKKYGEKTALENLNFEMDGPGVYALLGTNGAGKTTAIRMMLNMLSRDSGEVLWNGEPLDTATCNVGYLAEERGLYPKYTLMDQLSKGNQQKIQFMMALVSDPELIILDEPMSGLDPVNTDLFRSIIHEEIEKGKYLIMSSHQMATVEEFCTDIIILNRSRTILQGNLNEIKKSFGRIHLSLKVEQNIESYIEQAGVGMLSEKEFEYELKVSGEEQANQLLGMLIADKIPVIRFDLREPSLHEIFVKKVGEANEA